VIIILLAAVLWIAFSGGRTGANAATVAVLPFSDMSPDGSQSHIGEGIAEEVMGLLSADANMAVMGRGSAWQFRENPAELARIGATHALEGSVRSGRTELVVTARLVELRSGEQVWSERYEQPTANIFEVQEQIGQAVAKQLRGIFDAERQVQLAAARRTSPRAYHLFLAARAANTERSYDGATKAEKLLEQALAIDPDYAPAHAEMAITQALIAQSRPSGAGDFDRHKALLHAQRAVELAPNLANAHVALGMTIEDPEAKLRAYTKATDLDPGNIRAWNQLGNLQLRFRCEFRDAAASFQRAAAIDPLGVSVWQNLASTLFMIGRTRESEEMVGRFQANSRSPADRARLMMEHKYRMGEIAEAVGHARRGLKLLPNDPQMSVHLAWGLRSLGRTSDAIVALPSGYRAMVGSYWRGEHEQAAAALSRDHQAPPERLRLVAGKALLWAQRPDRAAHLMMNGEPTAQFAKQQFCFDNDAAPVVHALQSTGRGREAFAVLRRAEEDLTKAAANGRADYERHTYAATLAAARGQGAAAMSHLEQAIASGWVGQYHTIGPSLDDPVFAALRPTRRFEAIERVLRNRLAAQTRLLAALEKQVIAERQQARR
jgi:TolB-like protein/Tfp pilus assembly protein PilF